MSSTTMNFTDATQKPASTSLNTAGMFAASPGMQRPRARGKFLFTGNSKVLVPGATYGAFQPDASGREYHDTKTLERDFALMAANGFNAVRIPHTTPPRELLDIAQNYGLRVMIGLSAEQFAGYLIDRKGAPDIVKIIRAKAKSCAGQKRCYG